MRRLSPVNSAPSDAGRARSRVSTLRSRLVRVIRLVVLIYIGLLIALYLFQKRLVFAGASTQGQPDAVVRPRPDAETVELQTRAGERVVALLGLALTKEGAPHDAAVNRPTMIYFYGNGNCLNQALPEFDRFRRLGLNVLIADYVGYGMSGGVASEQGCQATADAAYDFLVSRRKVDPKRMISAGWSLGGAVAIDLAARRPVGGLMAFSTFTSAVELAQRKLPLVPISLLLQPRFESLQKIVTIRCPILIGHGRRDNIIPFWMGEQLAAAAGGAVTTVWIDRAAHKHIFENGGPQIDEAIKRLVEAVGAP
jgi:uncharacterized protein